MSRPETPSLTEGMLVERYIEGLWFEAEIISLHHRSQTAKIKYMDEGNVEEDVPFEDLRPIEVEESDSNHLNRSLIASASTKRFGELKRPLSGLIEDDYDIRSKHVPVVTIHHDSETEVIILNGAENKLAAGGGLRALRYLNKTKT